MGTLDVLLVGPSGTGRPGFVIGSEVGGGGPCRGTESSPVESGPARRT